MRVNYLSKRETSMLVERIRSLYWGEVLRGKIRNAMEIREDGIKLYRIGELIVGEIDEKLYPVIHERNLEALDRLPSMIVDMGAVPHIVNGADVMRPGVKDFRGEFNEGDFVVVRDERNLRPLAVAIALVGLEECRAMKRGKVAKNIHHVNDRIWKLMRKIRHILEREL
ncbi:MAG: pseudouridine synthase [Thaumarchaeota archaeon]|nr:pseudouridine synthase [Nitrososphaerota archaeon]